MPPATGVWPAGSVPENHRWCQAGPFQKGGSTASREALRAEEFRAEDRTPLPTFPFQGRLLFSSLSPSLGKPRRRQLVSLCSPVGRGRGPVWGQRKVEEAGCAHASVAGGRGC